jgi:hypothetical protein
MPQVVLEAALFILPISRDFPCLFSSIFSPAMIRIASLAVYGCMLLRLIESTQGQGLGLIISYGEEGCNGNPLQIMLGPNEQQCYWLADQTASVE